jgi:hypothetical protein
LAAGGTPNEICCGRLIAQQPVAYCLRPNECSAIGGQELCDPLAPTACSLSGGSCLPSRVPELAGYDACQ